VADFEQAIAFVLSQEGGYQCRASDPGNWTGGAKGQGELKGTNFGISSKSYPNEDIKGMTVERAKEIYRRDYWTPIGGDALPDGVAVALLDAAVNQGVVRAVKWVQSALDTDVVDGIVGPRTVAAARNDCGRWLVPFLLHRHAAYMKTIAANPEMIEWAGTWAERLFLLEKMVLGIHAA